MKKKLSKEEILKLAKKKGIKLSFLNSLIGGYRGRLTDWKNGKTSLTESETEIIVNYLLGTDNASVDEKNTLSSDENNLIELFRSVDDFGREAIKDTASHEQKRWLSERSLSRMNKKQAIHHLICLNLAIQNNRHLLNHHKHISLTRH